MFDDLSNTSVVTVAKPRKRLFETGQLKLLVLFLVSTSQKYSYELMKNIGEIVGCGYTPSTGTIYPTLDYLVKEQYIEIQMGSDKRKRYGITSNGREYLKLQKDQIDQILSHFKTRQQIENNAQFQEIKLAMDQLKTALNKKIHDDHLSPEQIGTIAQIIQRAAYQIVQI